MSRIGKQPVGVPKGVTVNISDGTINVKGPKGELTDKINELTEVGWDESARQINIERKNDSRQARAAHGLQRALINNMVIGVTDGYSRGMEVHGTGYTVDVKGNKVELSVGYAAPGVAEIPSGLSVTVDQRAAQPGNPAKFTITGCDKQMLGQFAAEVKQIKPPEPYQGKGIRYAGEQIRRKEGKAVVGAGA